MQRKIRVLFVNHTAKLGGGELALCALIRHLDPALIDHRVLLCEEGPLVERLRMFTEVHVEPLSGELREARKDGLSSGKIDFFKKGMELVGYVWRLSRTIKRLRVDLVHTNSLKADILGGLAARLAGTKVIWHIRDRIEVDYLPARVVSFFRQLTRWIPHAVITNSHATMETLHLIPHGDLRKERLAWKGLSRVIHDGFDFSTSSKKQAITAGAVTIGLIGRISPWKGQDVFLRAAAIVHQSFPEVRFQIIGSALFGEEEYERHIHKLCMDLQLDCCVDFLGFISNIQMEIERLDLVVHASTIGEPFGQVVIEGMAAGKAIIATRGGGIPEIVLNGETGILVAMKDSQSMANAMLTLLSHPEQRAEMGNKGFQRVVDYFRIEKTADGVSRFYQELSQSDS
ncbi:glycosyltransferase family 4 protein [Granulicella tundricola]|uniref:Glycosyl transferase group 1 n=1 Tax=Granulicella tundricola (strain ATCC BAA-1859 / DSM 23138 / MP5ACTX9) TaxID=1198114 RepID=E8X7R9_GRATM|nr:glycosyltransferase family 4 protein [Granulicella tundricola]ADW71503.1 glycosyl transferase group 1 [Granulicella tundricola MP5ACTX9]